jgi:molecular chaperone GrpE
MAKSKESKEIQDEVADNEIKNKEQSSDADEDKSSEKDDAALKEQLTEKEKKCSEYLSMLQRTAAEFDNYKKRTSKEKEAIYNDAVSDAILAFLPVVDSMERASQVFNESEDKALKEGFGLVIRQMNEALKKLGVEEIKSVGEQFNPELHNAVMHIEDEAYGSNEVVEEFQKGYMIEDKIIRHSMVKVAN